jgi:uncharacterized membrane protein
MNQQLIQKQTHSGSRLYALDMARFIAMIMMIQGHTMYTMVDHQFIDVQSFPWSWWNFLRGLTAPIFLFVSGAVHVFAMKRSQSGSISKETLKKRLQWIAIIFICGYLLVFPASRLIDLPYLDTSIWRQFLQFNILQLTPFTLLFVLALSYITHSVKALGIISGISALIIFISTPYIQNIDVFAFLPETFGAMISYKHGSLFPIFPFSGFMLGGVAFGAWLQSLHQEKRSAFFNKHIFLLSIIVISIALIAMYWTNLWMPRPVHNDAMMTNPAFMFVRIGIILFLFGICQRFVNLFDSYKHHFVFFSSKSLHIYVIHLILLYGTPWFPSIGRTFQYSQSLIAGAGLAVLIILLTLGLVIAEDEIKRRSPKSYKYIRNSLGLLLLYALLV